MDDVTVKGIKFRDEVIICDDIALLVSVTNGSGTIEVVVVVRVVVGIITEIVVTDVKD